MKKNKDKNKLLSDLLEIGERAKIASRQLATLDSFTKNNILKAMADALESDIEQILKENNKDINNAIAKNIPKPMLDRLKLDEKRVKNIAEAVRNIITLEDPVGKILSTTIRPNGLKIEKVSTPIGVIAIIYEARPNVTVDSAVLCIKAGNAVILRGGSEAFHSNQALLHCINRAALEAGLPEGAMQMIPTTDRNSVYQLLKLNQYIDLVIPRGGENLIRTVTENSTIPVIKHYKGVCHIYVDADANLEMAEKIIINAKCQRPAVCNAVEKILIHKSVAKQFAPQIALALKKHSVEIRADEKFRKIFSDAKPATEKDWHEEYLDLIITIKIVDSLQEAIDHINFFGSQHSDAIITDNTANAREFLSKVDSAVVYHNASTRFTDGGEFGMGAEIGISTDKIHARGPMALPELNTYKYIVYGSGQCRT